MQIPAGAPSSIAETSWDVVLGIVAEVMQVRTMYYPNST